MERGLTVDALVDEAAARHGLPRDAVEPAVLRFLAELDEEGLIAAADGAAPLVAPAATAEGAADDGGFPTPRLERYTDMQELLLLDPIHDVDERGWPNAVEAGRETGGA